MPKTKVAGLGVTRSSLQPSHQCASAHLSEESSVFEEGISSEIKLNIMYKSY